MNNIPEEIRSNNWLKYVSGFPVAFAQVREDSLIDQWITNQLPVSANGIMIASGGCTAALLAASKRFEHLTLVDMNPGQLELARLKISLINDCNAEERLNILGHRSDVQYKNYRLNELKRYNISDKIFGLPENVFNLGLDYIGRYELLFSRLQYVISGFADTTEKLLNFEDPSMQRDFLQDNPKYLKHLQQAFTEVMSLPSLISLFGKEATQNSIRSFSEHFFMRS